MERQNLISRPVQNLCTVIVSASPSVEGRIIAAVVSAADLKELEEMDPVAARLHRQAMARARERGEKPIPLAKAKKMLGL